MKSGCAKTTGTFLLISRDRRQKEEVSFHSWARLQCKRKDIEGRKKSRCPSWNKATPWMREGYLGKEGLPYIKGTCAAVLHETPPKTTVWRDVQKLQRIGCSARLAMKPERSGFRSGNHSIGISNNVKRWRTVLCRELDVGDKLSNHREKAWLLKHSIFFVGASSEKLHTVHSFSFKAVSQKFSMYKKDYYILVWKYSFFEQARSIMEDVQFGFRSVRLVQKTKNDFESFTCLTARYQAGCFKSSFTNISFFNFFNSSLVKK